jgi:hypothetical protein
MKATLSAEILLGEVSGFVVGCMRINGKRDTLIILGNRAASTEKELEIFVEFLMIRSFPDKAMVVHLSAEL